MTFNLDPPPGFRGLNPYEPITIYNRNLPHWRQAGESYFVTFNLADALPASKRHELEAMRRDWEHRNPPPRNEEHLYHVVQYIGDNPHRAGIAREHWNRWINPEWQATGWDFEEPS